MKIQLWSDDLLTRTRLESAWRQAGAEILKPRDEVQPDLVVVDLTARDALARIERLRAAHPTLEIVAFGPHVAAEALQAARAAGASAVVTRGKVLERVRARIAPAG